MIEIYTDGAYSSKRNQGGIGIIFLKEGKEIASFSKPYSNTTNNRMEMLAVIIALNSIKNPVDKIIIYSDSMYVIGCATLGWKRKKNQDLWEKYDTVYKKALTLCENITFKHVKGHSDDRYNNICDKLAVAASQII